ncbi:MAG: nucleotidyltransferase domain-containing protein [archaeon]|nr:nucleotidyltransferase domain-containing protein [archaeon]
MLQKNNRQKILRMFFDDPIPKGIGFQLREISRKTVIAPPSVKRYLEEFGKEKIVIKEEHRIHKYPVYYANREGEYFRFLKKMDNLLKIKESGIVDYLRDKCMPDAIVLFGSASRGEDTKESDIDLYLLSQEEKLNLAEFEKKLGRKINLLFEENFNKLSKELKNNIINGTILKGYLKVF